MNTQCQSWLTCPWIVATCVCPSPISLHCVHAGCGPLTRIWACCDLVPKFRLGQSLHLIGKKIVDHYHQAIKRSNDTSHEFWLVLKRCLVSQAHRTIMHIMNISNADQAYQPTQKSSMLLSMQPTSTKTIMCHVQLLCRVSNSTNCLFFIMQT